MDGRASAIAKDNGKSRQPIGMIQLRQSHVRLRVLAIGDDATVGDLADQYLHHRMVAAHHCEAVERHVLDKSAGATVSATDICSRTRSATMSPRRTIGSRLARAAVSSGLSRLMAVETTTTAASSRAPAEWPTDIFAPLSRRRLTFALSDASEPC